MTAARNPAPEPDPVRGEPAHGGSTALLWDRYRTRRDEGARDELLRRHLPLVRFVARRMSSKTTAVEYEELVSAGVLGLMAALEGYDPSRGFAFTTYAVTRVQGAILDDLRKRDWMPRSSRKRSRQLGVARARLETRLLRAPTASEVARELGLDLQLYWRWCDELDATSHGRAAVETGSELRLHAERPGAEPGSVEHPSPEQQLLADEQRARVRAAIAGLPEREQQVLALCYFEELTLRQAGAVLGVTESRVSQLRKQALQRLAPLLQS